MQPSWAQPLLMALLGHCCTKVLAWLSEREWIPSCVILTQPSALALNHRLPLCTWETLNLEVTPRGGLAWAQPCCLSTRH